MDFWKIENRENVVEIKWSHNCFEDYKNLALDFYDCGYKTFEEVIDSGHDNVKSDMWFLAQLLSLIVRHATIFYSAQFFPSFQESPFWKIAVPG